MRASASASGIDPDEVLPKRSTLTIVRSSGMPSFAAAWSMMRLFAWCGTYTSTSSTLRPHCARIASADETITLVANLNTSRPFIFTSWSGIVEATRAATGQPQVLTAAAVCAELEAEKAATRDGLHHDRPRSVAEQHQRRAVAPVEDLREHVAPDHERAAGEAGGEHPVGLRDGVDEPGAAREQVVGGRVAARPARPP